MTPEKKSEPLVVFSGDSATIVFNPPEECRRCHTMKAFFVVRMRSVRANGDRLPNADPLCVDCDAKEEP